MWSVCMWVSTTASTSSTPMPAAANSPGSRPGHGGLEEPARVELQQLGDLVLGDPLLAQSRQYCLVDVAVVPVRQDHRQQSLIEPVDVAGRVLGQHHRTGVTTPDQLRHGGD